MRLVEDTPKAAKLRPVTEFAPLNMVPSYGYMLTRVAEVRMNVAVITRPADPLSLRLYEANMIRGICALGVEVTPVSEKGPIPDVCDILWDPSMCMRRVPSVLKTSDVPVVGTMHGVKVFSLGIGELAINEQDQSSLIQLKEELVEDWTWFRDKVRAVIAVSAFAAREVIKAFDLSSDLVHVIHHGVNQSIFSPDGESAEHGVPYFLHVSRMDPIKNTDRILEAYSLLPKADRPGLVAVVVSDEEQKAMEPEFERKSEEAGVHWLRNEMPQEELARWYRGALALVLPSLRETFGLPIIEAMSCGCPVITSNSTGCAEVAGPAAVLVDPYSIRDIADSMQRVANYPTLRRECRLRGLDRTSLFTWKRSADMLVKVFESIVATTPPTN